MNKWISLPYTEKKKKNKPNTASQLYSNIKKSNVKRKTKENKEMPRILPSGLGVGMLSLPRSPSRPGSPRLDCGAADRAAEEVSANESLLGLEGRVPVDGTPIS